MAAPNNNKPDCWRVPEVYKHHEQQKVCISRPKYREGRKAKSVKVYTINLESQYVMIQGVPAIGVMAELIQLCALYGAVEEYRPLDEYPAEEFTEVYLVKFQKLTSARAAKRQMDEKSFYGGVLHVCYVPEYETVEDTRLKLQDRRRYIMRATRNIAKEREHREETKKEFLHSGTAATLETVTTAHDESLDDQPKESFNSSNSCFPLLPLPPQEYHYQGLKNQHRTAPTEDKMGTLHNAYTDTEQPRQSPSWSQASSDQYRSKECKLIPTRAPAVRFVPRTTQLEIRKRKIDEDEEQSLMDGTEKNQPFIGPKLPEPLKLDMEDESLNTTVNLIRNTMRQVESVPELKPVTKKIKPRRRI
ncbi:RNA-binding protein 48 [Sphaeramia orbicularis]|uniref:RNA-binding protein 48 n=1 Tax=Sphaeramia orbicularis TaxID=375764 RepID=A0A673CIC7_9TELE|nr:RNA-binding protein 48 [Sphaeramia orbicularis]